MAGIKRADWFKILAAHKRHQGWRGGEKTHVSACVSLCSISLLRPHVRVSPRQTNRRAEDDRQRKRGPIDRLTDFEAQVGEKRRTNASESSAQVLPSCGWHVRTHADFRLRRIECLWGGASSFLLPRARGEEDEGLERGWGGLAVPIRVVCVRLCVCPKGNVFVRLVRLLTHAGWQQWEDQATFSLDLGYS